MASFSCSMFIDKTSSRENKITFPSKFFIIAENATNLTKLSNSDLSGEKTHYGYAFSVPAIASCYLAECMIYKYTFRTYVPAYGIYYYGYSHWLWVIFTGIRYASQSIKNWIDWLNVWLYTSLTIKTSLDGNIKFKHEIGKISIEVGGKKHHVYL